MTTLMVVDGDREKDAQGGNPAPANELADRGINATDVAKRWACGAAVHIAG